MIEFRGRKFRDHLHLYEEYEKELAETRPKAVPEPTPSEDKLIQQEQIEALNKAHEPTDKAQESAGTALVGKKSWQDWKTFRDL